MKNLLLLFFAAILGSNPLVADINVIGSGSATEITNGLTVSGAVDLGTSTTQITVGTAGSCGTGNVCSGTWTATTDACASCTGTGEDQESFMRVGNVTHYALRISISGSSSADFQITIGGLPFNASQCHGKFAGGGINLDAAHCSLFRITNTTVGLECNTLDGTSAGGAQNIVGTFQCLD